MKNEELKAAIDKYIESKELVLMGYPPEYIDDVKTDMEIAFRVGAEWMANQGETTIAKAKADLDPHGADYGLRHLDLEIADNTPIGTEFIVQIRKKQ